MLIGDIQNNIGHIRFLQVLNGKNNWFVCLRGCRLKQFAFTENITLLMNICFFLGDEECCNNLCSKIPSSAVDTCLGICILAGPVTNGPSACKPICNQIFTPDSTLDKVCITACKIALIFCGE